MLEAQNHGHRDKKIIKKNITDIFRKLTIIIVFRRIHFKKNIREKNQKNHRYREKDYKQKKKESCIFFKN